MQCLNEHREAIRIIGQSPFRRIDMLAWVQPVLATYGPWEKEPHVFDPELVPRMVDFFARRSSPSTGCIYAMVAVGGEREGPIESREDFICCETC